MLNLCVSHTTITRVPSTFQSGHLDHVIKCSRLCLGTIQLDCHVSPDLLFVSSFKGLQFCKALHLSNHSEMALHNNYEECKEQVYSSYEKRETSAEGTNLDNSLAKEDTERERRRKIGLANKGRTPWNKGKKHSAETRERIRQRTKEALNDPKVRKKMSDCPRTLSNQTKAKISTSIRRFWGERLKHKRSGEQILLSWAESIAEAAKRGGHGQRQLDWDSYEKIKEEIALHQFQRAAEKVQAKEVAQTRAHSLAKAKAEKIKKLALSKQKALLRRWAKKKAPKRSNGDKDRMAVSEDINLKETMTEVHRAWEKLDPELMKREQRRKKISLADQIRDVKTKKAELKEL